MNRYHPLAIIHSVEVFHIHMEGFLSRGCYQTFLNRIFSENLVSYGTVREPGPVTRIPV